MSWTVCEKNETADVISYLEKQEPLSVSMLSRISRQKKSSPRFPVHERLFTRKDSKGTIDGVILVLKRGMVYPMVSGLRDDAETEQREVREILIKLRDPVSSIIGESESVCLVSNSAKRTKYTGIDYDFLENREKDIELKALPSGYSIRIAGVKDAGIIFPLQAAYEKEEVLISEDRFNSIASFSNLEHDLETETVFILEKDGIPVAKAGTNARGSRYAQIGGVYTLPAFRGRGFGRATVSALVNYLSGISFPPAFSSKRKQQTKSLYSSIGFKS